MNRTVRLLLAGTALAVSLQLVQIAMGGFAPLQTAFAKVEKVVKDRYAELQLFTKVLNLVQQYYVEEVDTKKLIYGGIKGMLLDLDPHTNFLPPEVHKEFENETSGEFGGLGVEITVQNDILTVISPIEDTPAWKAGILAGDRIVEVNGESTKGLSLAEAAQKMRGKNGSVVRLGIYRDGFDKPKEFAIQRGVVKLKSVKPIDFEDGYLYVRLTSFIENSYSEFDRAIKAHMKRHKVMKGLVIDLRRNPGGLLDQAVKISDMFLDQGIIVSTIGRNKNEKEVIEAKKDDALLGFPIIVLVNEASASASEILAGALQDNRRALVMGSQTFGKGSVQSVVKLGDGSALKLTVARYYTPSGKSIQGVGIRPDVLVEEVDPEQFKKAIIKREVRREADLGGHLVGELEERAESNRSGAPSSKAANEKRSGAESNYEKEQDGDDAKKTTQNGATELWYKGEKKDKDKLSPRDRMLSEDYQVLQAYNTLRAWKVMEQFSSSGQVKAPIDPKQQSTN